MIGKEMLKTTLTKSGAYMSFGGDSTKHQEIRSFVETLVPTKERDFHEFYLLLNGVFYFAKFTQNLISIGPVKLSKPVSFTRL